MFLFHKQRQTRKQEPVHKNTLKKDENCGIQLKEQYLNEKIVLDTYGSASITVKLETKYDYYEVKSYGTSHQTKTTTDTIYFYFYSVDEMKSGKSMSSSSSIFISSFNDYYDMDISYEADFGILQSGTIIIYD